MTVETGLILFVAAQAISIGAGIWRFASKTNTRLVTLETKVEHFWNALGKTAAAVLHSPHTPDRDRLLERYMRNEISWEELLRLIEDLRELEQTGEAPQAQLARVLLRSIENTRDLRALVKKDENNH